MNERRPSVAETPWWRGAVIYQIYPRSFLDTSGNGVGDLRGVLKGLDHVASLGVDGIWLSPFFASPMKDFGYDVSDHRMVDPMFGTLADFDAVLDKARHLGLKVIIDQVYSHTSDQHAWFQESRKDRTNPKADWYVWANPKPDGAPPNNWQSVFGGPSWTWDARRGQYYLHNFLDSQPDLNLHNAKVQDALLDIGRFWLDRGVDGFRLDAINFAMHDPLLRDNPPDLSTTRARTRPFDFQKQQYNMSHPDIPKFLRRIRALTDSYNAIFTVAETTGPDATAEMKTFTADGEHLDSAYNFAFLYAERLTPALCREALEDWTGAPGEGWPSWAFSNHDAPRCVSRWAPPEYRAQAAKLYIALLMSLRGNAFLYQGEELGLPQANVPFEALQDPEAIANWPQTLGRDGARTPLPWTSEAPLAGFSTAPPWLPIDPAHVPLAIAEQAPDRDSTLNFTRRFLALRRRERALRWGDLRFLDNDAGLLAFARSWRDDEIHCVFNLDNRAASWRPESPGSLDTLTTVGVSDAAGTLPEQLPPYSCYLAKRR